MLRRSPGSPSHRMAVLSRRGPVRWRSRQLYEALIFPPTNHFACGSFHSTTRSQRLNQCSRSAWAAQKRSGSSCACCQRASYSARLLTCAFAEKSGGGGKVRCSLRMLVMCDVEGEVMRELQGRGRASVVSRGHSKRSRNGREAHGASPLSPGGEGLGVRGLD